MNRKPTPRLTDFEALTFDCYGTLIDWEAGIWDAFQPLILENGGSGPARDALLEAFGRFESRRQTATPGMLYPEVLCRVHRDLAQHFGLETTARLDLEFGRSISHWPAFPDSAEALRFLKSRFRLFVISNVNRAGFAASHRKLGVVFDAVYTAEDIGSYKPDIANFEYLLRELQADFGLGKTAILHTAQSLYHDHIPAASVGLATAWIDRQRLSESGKWGATRESSERPDANYLFFSLREMANAVKAEEEAGA